MKQKSIDRKTGSATSAGSRHKVSIINKELSGKTYKKLTVKKTKNGGRNNKGRITVRHKGGGHKQRYRVIDFKRNKDGIEGKVERLEYDPNRSANIALILYKDGERRYIIAPNKIKVGDKIISGSGIEGARVGDSAPLRYIKPGTAVHCVEAKVGKGAQFAKSAGTSAYFTNIDGDYAILKMPSKELRRVSLDCRATIGEVGGKNHNLRKLGKAGASRHRGIRPTVRGVAMNPVDHPMGGGEGRSSGGRHPCTPWGVATKGKKTRNNKRTDKFIVQRSNNRKDK